VLSLLSVGARMAPAVATYAPRDPSGTVLYHVIAEHLETFLGSLADDPGATGLPAYVQREFYDYLRCGILAHGFLRLGCDTCHHELLVPFSCKRRGFCPSCAGRRMAQTAAHLVEQVIPWVPTRQWVVSVPIPLRYWMASSQALTAKVHTIIRTTIGQYYVNQVVTQGYEQAHVHPGSVTFIQRFGSALNSNLHFHCVFMEGVYLDRTNEGHTPRFLAGAPPTDGDITTVLQQISRRVIRKLCRLGYLETGVEAPVATGDDPLRATAHGAALRQRQRLFPPWQHADPGPSPRSVGTAHSLYRPWGRVPGAPDARHQRRSRLHLHPSLGRRHHRHSPLPAGTPGEARGARAPAACASGALWGGLAPHSHLRGAILPTPRQQGVDGEEAQPGTPYWPWPRLLKRVFDLEMATCPLCQRGVLRLIAVITQGEVIRKILRHLKLSVDPPPIAPARTRQETYAFT